MLRATAQSLFICNAVEPGGGGVNRRMESIAAQNNQRFTLTRPGACLRARTNTRKPIPSIVFLVDALTRKRLIGELGELVGVGCHRFEKGVHIPRWTGTPGRSARQSTFQRSFPKSGRETGPGRQTHRG